MDNSSHRPPRLRRKSSAFKLSLSRASHSSLSTPLPPTPSLSTDFDPSTNATDYTLVIPSTTLSTSPDSPITMQNPSTGPSLSSNTGGGVGSFPNVPSASLSSTLEGLRQLVGKRITAWTYLRNVGMGKVYWFNTVLLTNSDLRSSFPNDKMRTRSTRLAILGMSLSSLLEIQPAHDFLRSLQNLSSEFDQIPEDKFSFLTTQSSIGVGTSLGVGGGGGGGGGTRGVGQKGSLFRGKRKPGEKSGKEGTGQGGQGGGGSSGGGGGGGGGGAEFASGEGGESGYLFIPNIPFDLDYFQVLTTTCELLIETYTKIYSYLGGFTPSSAANTPSLSSSSSSSSPFFPSSTDSLKPQTSTGGGGLSQSLAEIVLKIDSRLKKLIGVLSKEIDTLARQAIRNELDLLGGGVEGWGNFEGLGGGTGSGGGVMVGGD
ncbi:hypothetical protein JCM5353_003703 [Sporobolomyces roseus]